MQIKEVTRINVKRVLIYLCGMTVLALGLTLNTKAGLGVSPALSIPYGSSQIFRVSLGDAIFAFYTLFVIIQLALHKMQGLLRDLSQLPLSLLFSRAMNFFDCIVSYDYTSHTILSNFIILTVAVLLTGIGVAITLNMRIIPNPADGLVQAISDRAGISTGTSKNIFDFCCMFVTIAICLAADSCIIGINTGTVVCMVCVGRVVTVVNHYWYAKMLQAAEMTDSKS